MSKINKTDIDLFSNLSDAEFKLIQSSFTYERKKKGEILINENTLVSHIFFIKTGLVKLSCFDQDNKECILSFGFENWWETDFEAFYLQKKSNLQLQCIEDTEVLMLNHKDFLSLINVYQLSNYFLDKSIKGHIANQKRIVSLLTLDAKKRYEYFLDVYPTLVQRIPKSILALYLGVSRETLSRLYS